MYIYNTQQGSFANLWRKKWLFMMDKVAFNSMNIYECDIQ